MGVVGSRCQRSDRARMGMVARGFRPWETSDVATRLNGCLLILILLSSPPGHAHALGEFIPAGARSAGMGDVYAGLAEGAEGVMWNPGLSRLGMACRRLRGMNGRSD